MNIYESDDYKAILKETLLTKKFQNKSKYTFEKMADACRIEKAYLSRTLNGESHLSQDQLFLACKFLGYPDEERHYLFLLHQYARSGLAAHKKELKGQIESLRKRHKKTESYIKAPLASPNSQQMMGYFLDFNAQLVHMLLTIEKYARNPGLIAKVLHLPESAVFELIGKLEDLQIVEYELAKYRVVKESLHLSSDSPYYKAYRLAARMKSMERLQASVSDQAYSLSVTFSSTETVHERIRKEFMAFLTKVNDLVEESESEDVFQMNFDLFPWT